MVNRVFCFVGEKNGVKYLKTDKLAGNFSDSILSKWNQVFDSIKYHITKINNEECKAFPEVNFDDDFGKVKFITDDNLPLEKLIYFPTKTIVFRCVFKQGDLFYPQSLFR